ncbi:hypothetical protein D3C85_1048660 [compost metagenome]
MAPQGNGVLAGHQGMVAQVIGGGVGHIARGEDVWLADDFQVGIHMQAAQGIALGGDLLGKRAGPHTGGPDHGPGVDTMAVGQRHAVFVDGDHRRFQVPLHTQLVARLGNGLADGFALGGADFFAAVDDDHIDVSLLAHYRAQARWHFGCGLDAGEAATRDHHGIARFACGLVGQGLEVLFQLDRLLDLVHIESVFGHARGIGHCQAATSGQHQFVVAAHLPVCESIDVLDVLLMNVDGFGSTLDEVDPYRIEQLAQWCGQSVGVGLVEAWANTQLGLRRQHRDGRVGMTVQVQQPSCAQCRPHTTKTCADYQDVLFHF